MEAYLDNSATTKVYDTVVDIMAKTMMEDYGNPSSKHMKGVKAENYIKEAKKIIAGILKVQEKEIYFTSGGTESNNLALIGTAYANQRSGRHIITSRIEHSSVLNTVEFLEDEGFRITYLPVDENGLILLDKLEEAISDDTILVSIMHVNNEIGTVQPIEKIGKIIKQKKPDVLFHVDAVQAFGKYRIYPNKWNVDLLSVSAHKIHGPKGSGALYVKSNVKIKPLIHGGFQQNGVRHGTENVPGIAGIGEAARRIYSNMEQDFERISRLKKAFINRLNEFEDISLNSGNEDYFAPYVVSASFEGIKSEVLLHALEEKEIYVSSGSACSSNKNALSETLKAIGVKKDLLDCTIRFSLSGETTKEELDYCLDTLKELLPKLRLYRKR